jgi:hypothetical protein
MVQIPDLSITSVCRVFGEVKKNNDFNESLIIRILNLNKNNGQINENVV